ncbi:MAG TPA: glycosyltransferase family 2 protein [Rectinemataceae bacterium]|nr:glycosyltransferase family 2 protein [Rectinemataceae bacterium]
MRIAVVLPAYNEELCIEQVILDFHRHLPEALIHVVDNNSSDGTGSIARAVMASHSIAGSVMFVREQGKANAVRRAFEEIDADLYVMADADTTYAGSEARTLIQPVAEGRADMVVGDRHAAGVYREQNKRRFHDFGNNLVKNVINLLFRSELHDVLSGYRVFSRRFVKNFPILSKGFDLETEMSVHALSHRFSVLELPISYKDRPAGSFSKLNTFSDGILVMRKILGLFIAHSPLRFFNVFCALSALVSLAVGISPVLEYLETGFVKKLPSLVAASGFLVLALLFFAIGLLLEMSRQYQLTNYHHRVLNFTALDRRRGD